MRYAFAALLNERQKDLAFFDQRIEERLVAKLDRIVSSARRTLAYVTSQASRNAAPAKVAL